MDAIEEIKERITELIEAAQMDAGATESQCGCAEARFFELKRFISALDALTRRAEEAERERDERHHFWAEGEARLAEKQAALMAVVDERDELRDDVEVASKEIQRLLKHAENSCLEYDRFRAENERLRAALGIDA